MFKELICKDNPEVVIFIIPQILATLVGSQHDLNSLRRNFGDSR